MGLWGAVDLVTTGPVTVRSPMVVTHFEDDSLNIADLTVYAELHNATGNTVKGVVSGTAAGVKFEQPVELAAKRRSDRCHSRLSSFRNCAFTIQKSGGPGRWATRILSA